MAFVAFLAAQTWENSAFSRESSHCWLPSLWKIPREWYEIKDPDIKYRKVPFFFPRDVEVPRPDRQQKHAGSLLQAKQSDFSCVFVKRQIIQTIRQFMSEEGFYGRGDVHP